MANISFLIGSGFSIPSGIPSTMDINNKFSNIKIDQFYIHTDLSAWFIRDGHEKPNNPRIAFASEQLFEEFIKLYNSELLNGKRFHYEDFFDYYYQQYRTEEYTKEFLSFADGFRAKFNYYTKDNYNLLNDINNTFQQLLASYLIHWNEPVHMDRGYKLSIANFLYLVDRIKDDNILNFHSLNHDLLFESFNSSDTFQGQLSDGFHDLGSPYYGKVEQRYKVRLKKFNNTFDTNYRFYKLHGSLDMYYFNDDQSVEIIKSDKGVSVTSFIKEIEVNGELKYHSFPFNYSPLFLTGTKEKIPFYKQLYYNEVFEHFTNNLELSDTLVIIGYGFWDSEINKMVKEHYIQKEMPIVVIDPNESDAPFFQEIKAYKFVHHIPSSVTDFNIDEAINIIKVE